MDPAGRIIIIPAPIGNLSDITLRVVPERGSG